MASDSLASIAVRSLLKISYPLSERLLVEQPLSPAVRLPWVSLLDGSGTGATSDISLQDGGD